MTKHRSLGALPPVRTALGHTAVLQQAQTAIRITEDLRDIACFVGEPGTGKTTAAAYAATQSARTWRYCVLPQRATPRAIAETLYESVFNRIPPKGERAASNLVLDRLIEGDIGLITDEVHHVGLTGMQQLRHLWDRATVQGGSFPLLLIGCDVYETLQRAPEVRTRIARWVSFHHLIVPEDAVIIAQALHPRLAASTPEMIEKINDRVAGANIRTWEQIAKHIAYLPSTDPDAKKAKALTPTDVRQIRVLIGADMAA